MATLNIKDFPDGLHHELKQRAAREHRSLAQQVVHLLTRCLEEQERLSIVELRGLGKDLWSGIDAAAHVDEERRSWD